MAVPGTPVQGEDWFGGDSACISVQAGPDDMFEVRFQAGVAVLSKETPATLHSWRDFSILHDALRSGLLAASEGHLPDLPARPAALLTSSDASRTAWQRTASELQEYLANLASFDQILRAPAFLKFLRDDALEETAPVVTDWTPTIVRRASRDLAASATPCKSVTLSWTDESGEHSVQLPVLQPNGGLGAPVVDVRSLYAKTGMFTHDPGFTSTSSCDSASAQA